MEERNRTIGSKDFYREYHRIYTGTEFELPQKEYNRLLNLLLLKMHDTLLNGEPIILPNRLGTLELRKFQPKLYMEEGKLINTLPIDWKATKELWSNDEAASSKKTLVRINTPFVFKLFYNKKNAIMPRRREYKFKFKRGLKRSLVPKIKQEEIEAYLF